METKYSELKAAKKALKDYFIKHNLSPLKSYSKDPVHGKPISLLVKKLNIERSKVLDNYAELDEGNTIKLVKLYYKTQKMAKEKKLKKERAAKEETAKKVSKKETQEEAKPKRQVAMKYEYPLIEGREMTKDEKKKYRAKLRRGNTSEDKPKKETKVKKEDKAKKEAKPKAEVKVEAKATEKKPKKAVKKEKEPAVPEKPIKKAKSKKAKKDED